MTCLSIGFINVIFQILRGPSDFYCKLSMILLITLLIIKTVSFLRIFPMFSPVVTLISQVMIDLRTFLFFFLIASLLTANFALAANKQVIELDFDRDADPHFEISRVEIVELNDFLSMC